ncbi:V-type proton ATPase subunit G [Quillaja saponaria]|uniref:V-type proton ATPase subunit G n=1 Tax=Quillaja saponaria TaxID=32244 RepID=A0AAD7LPV0_QUISA|nr:V-type proton ATPase subunit G [Quillaja saponaria]
MDPFRGKGGIQMLLTAEQEAQHVVSSARNLKLQTLKHAKEEAERDVALYRSQMETDYRKKISETSESSGSNVKRLEEETESKIQILKASASRVSPEIVVILIKYVTTVRT